VSRSIGAQRGERVLAAGAPRRQTGSQPGSDDEHERRADEREKERDGVEAPDT
jgi:hypothetical protein